MKKVLIHQPFKYGDYLIVIPIAQKLISLGYEVYLPFSSHTAELINYFDDIKFFEIGPIDLASSIKFCRENSCILINCQSPTGYDELFTTKGGKYFIEEMKYYVAEDIMRCGINYEDKFNLKWNRNIEKENSLIKLLNIDLNEDYVVAHLNGDNGRVGKVPFDEPRRVVRINKISGYTLLDWYPIILNSKAIYTIQSSAQCFVDAIKYKINHNELYLLNDTCLTDRLLVPAYGWNFKYFKKERLT